MICPYCGNNASLTNSVVVYGMEGYGNIWLCDNWPVCDAYVGAHSFTNKPLGVLANAELREWRKRTHAAFDPVWVSGYITRKQACTFMHKLMGMTEQQAHIGNFSVSDCELLINKMKRWHNEHGSLHTVDSQK